MRGLSKAHIARFLKILLAAGLLCWLLASDRLDVRGLAGIRQHLLWVLIAQISFGITVLLSALRWQLLLRVQGVRYALSGTFSLTMIGLFFNQVVFGSTGGDLYKAYAVANEHTDKRSGGIVSVFMDRALGMLALLFWVPIALIWNLDLVQAHLGLFSFAIAVVLVLIAVIAFAFLYFSMYLRRQPVARWLMSKLPFREILKQVDYAVNVYRTHLREILFAILLSLVIQFLVIATNVYLAFALLDPPFEWTRFLFLIPMAHVAMSIPINPPGAIGTAEAIYAYLFSLIGIYEGALICVLQRLTYLVWSFPGAVLYITRKGRPQVLARTLPSSRVN